jgi:hypothetical protein
MQEKAQIRPVRDLTAAQQRVLKTILNLPHPTFKTTEVAAILRIFDGKQILSLSGTLGSFVRLGILTKLSGGRTKTWHVAPWVQQQRGSLEYDLQTLAAEQDAASQWSIEQKPANRKMNTPETNQPVGSIADELDKLLEQSKGIRNNDTYDPSRYALKFPET